MSHRQRRDARRARVAVIVLVIALLALVAAALPTLRADPLAAPISMGIGLIVALLGLT